MKERIICESIESLRQEGLRFSVDTLAKRLNVSKKTIYKYFPNKYSYTTEQKDNLLNIILESLDDSITEQNKKALRIIINGSFEKLCNEKAAPDGVIDWLVNMLW